MRHPELKLAEGKTKIIWGIPGTPDEVLVESKDDITAGDGVRRDIIPGKAELANRTTSNCFKLLTMAGVPNHFIRQEDERTFRAQRVNMIPVELVARRVAYGSYIKRNPDIASGAVLDDIVLEFFAKDDPKHDPLLEFDFDGGTVRRYDPTRPVSSETLINEVPIAASPFGVGEEQVARLGHLTIGTFLILEAAWATQGTTLVDMKIECGYPANEPDELIVGDVIDNDSWRLWPGGNPDQMADKQLYREQRLPLEDIAARYAWVADATNQFMVH